MYRESGDVTLARSPKFNAPLAFGGAAHEGSRRRGAGNLFLLVASPCRLSRFPLSPHLEATPARMLLLYLVGSSAPVVLLSCPAILFPLDSLARRSIS